MADPVSQELYKKLLDALGPLGAFEEEVKKPPHHFVRRSAFAGVHSRKQFLLLTIKAAQPVRSPRVLKAEQVSKNRWHLAAELLGWLREAYELCG
jgi:hypothetical protein